MKVTIICSLKCEEKCRQAVDFFENLGVDEVYYPFVHQEDSLLEIQMKYLGEIVEADLIVAIPKDEDLGVKINDGSMIGEYFGESTSYELAYAMRMNKQIIIWR